MKFLWNISCLIVCLVVICLYCDSIKADQDGKFGERPQLVEKSLGTLLDLLRQELHKENRRDYDLPDESRKGPLLPCIYNGLKDLREHTVMRTRSMPEFDAYQSTSPFRHPSEHSMFYTPRLGRSFNNQKK